MAHYSQFNITDDHSYNVYNAIKYCKENNERELVFDKGFYEFHSDRASEEVLHISNHDVYGIQRIAFLLKDMADFTIDGSGSEFLFYGSMNPFAILNCENITLKNFSVDIDDTMTMELEVTDACEDYFEAIVKNSVKYYIKGEMLHFYNDDGDDDIFHYMTIRSMGKDKSFIAQSTDKFRISSPDIRFEDLGDKKIRVHKLGLKVEKNMHLITRGTVRYACDIFICESKDTIIDNVTLHKSYSMGVLGQKSENITIDKMTVAAKDDCLWSTNTDATHFVHCKGKIKVTNGDFSNHQDDALNVHGVYTQIVDKGEDYLLVRYMQNQAKGLNIYDKGSTFAVVNPLTGILVSEHKIKDVEIININHTKIYVEGTTDNIEVGNVVEDLTWSCDVEFKNNRVANNRARGILIGAKGKVLIENNYFNTPGIGIFFESDARFWFESGGTTYVEIKDNVFDNCKYAAGWGDSVIFFKPRPEFNYPQFYHKYISIENNKFINNKKKILSADNIERIIFKNNTIDGYKEVSFENCGVVDTDIE